MDRGKLLRSMYLMYRHSAMLNRPSDIILGSMEDEAIEIGLTIKVHPVALKAMKEMAEYAGGSIKDIMIDCLAHGMLEMGEMYDTIKLVEMDAIEKADLPAS